MAIVKMKKLSVLAVKSQREELLKKLMLLGCVEISQPEGLLEDEEAAPLLSRESVGAERCGAQYDSLKSALAVLDKFVPVKTGLLAPKPETSLQAVLSEKTLEKTLETAKIINDTDDKIKRIELENSHTQALIESLEPWKSLTVPFDLSETATCFVMPGVIPAGIDLKAVEAELAEAAPESQLFSVSDDRDMHYLLLVAMKTEKTEVMEVLRKYSFAQSSVSDLQGTAEENILGSKKRIAELEKKKEEYENRIIAAAGEREELMLCADRMLTKLGQAQNGEKFLYTEKALVFEGWFPAEKEEALSGVLSKFDCAWETADPEEGDLDKVPVELKSSRFSRPLNVVTNMYSLPAYDNLDPNPLMAPFFILFYGIMMADMAYGILMFLMGLIVLKKKKPTGTVRDFMGLLVECGISTFIWGALTGGFFGDAPLQVARMINPETTWAGLPALFSPVDDTIMILVGSMALGLVQIFTGMAISMVEKFKAHQYLDAVFEEITWYLVFAGIGCAALGAGSIVLYIALALVVLGPVIQGKGIGKISGIVASLYNHVTGYFGDILSYSRLMALMLAGCVIAQVFNTLATSTGNIVAFIIIFLVGHTLNFGLNLLSCYVHDMRLQCLEYFNKFYKDGGKAFQPLKVNSEYYVANN